MIQHATYFEGCQQDVSDNIFIDPTGNEYQCSKTPLTPDDTNQLSTCPIDKDQLYSGAWSIIVASNNGNAAPIAFERDFSLIVGIPSTITVYPTVTITSTATPTMTNSITTTSTGTTTATNTVTLPSITIRPTTTVIPTEITTTSTTTTKTHTSTAFTAEPLVTIVTYTKTCSLAPSQSTPDPAASVSPSLLAKRGAIPTGGAESFARNVYDPILDDLRMNKTAWLESRRQRLAAAHSLERRGLDRASVTTTETNPANFKTSTFVVPASVTSTITSMIEVTSFMTTYTTITVLAGATIESQSTVFAPTPTSTKITSTDATVTFTITQAPLITITVTTAPAASSSACKSLGGKLV
ncbi:hypothetical protein AMS68_004995 [Peltaster fructicola]|uniref:Uncharacterized protein n=1 Tax=Peltaster fructicola TaxID=286661 RepID=A0A6H0XY09_9PEZI|nr:hypothetical protein AMS68_004995 [Peltaster fructicola]